MHGKESHGKKSDYCKQLREKQKARRIFGVSEKQIQKYFKNATASKEESGAQLIRQMEHRLDNAVFRSGFATTRRQARQFVAHGIFTLNGKRINIPSAQLKEGDVFAVRTKSKTIPFFENFAKKTLSVPAWIKVDPANLSAQVVSRATKEDLEASINPQMIIEFYSR
jgi:small subunit ribosomal protein S4